MARESDLLFESSGFLSLADCGVVGTDQRIPASLFQSLTAKEMDMAHLVNLQIQCSSQIIRFLVNNVLSLLF